MTWRKYEYEIYHNTTTLHTTRYRGRDHLYSDMSRSLLTTRMVKENPLTTIVHTEIILIKDFPVHEPNILNNEFLSRHPQLVPAGSILWSMSRNQVNQPIPFLSGDQDPMTGNNDAWSAFLSQVELNNILPFKYPKTQSLMSGRWPSKC